MYQIWYLLYKIHLNHLKLHLGRLGGWRLGTTVVHYLLANCVPKLKLYWQIIGLMGGLILHQSFTCSELELVVFVGRDHYILPASRCQTCLSVSPLFAAVCVCRHTHTQTHTHTHTLSQPHFSSCFVAVLLSKRLLPANQPLSIHIALSLILTQTLTNYRFI